MDIIKTPHIDSNDLDFAKTVLMPGDPKRSEFIAKNFLENTKLVNNVRGICGYTGFYEGEKISVMASGMGTASIGIYSYELFNFFGVDNIIRVGSIGAMQKNINIRDIIIASAASTDSNFASQFNLNGTLSAVATYNLLKTMTESADKLNLKYHVGSILTSDIYYNENENALKKWSKVGILGVEMESYALYVNSQRAKKSALTICTVSNVIGEKQETTALERELGFAEMIRLALFAVKNIKSDTV